MIKRKTIFLALIIISLLIGTTTLVQAVPPLPSSFYGTVQINGENVEEGTVISAWIEGVQYASTTTIFHEGVSVFAIDVPGDDPTTGGVIEGGTKDQTIVFKIGEIEADETALWRSGTYVNCDLSAWVLTVVADSQEKVYGEDDPELTYSYTPDDDEIIFDGALDREEGEDVGTYAITQGDLSAEGYFILFNSAELTITPKPITITADAKSKAYGAFDPSLTYKSNVPLVVGDNFTGGLARVAGENVGTYEILQGTLKIDDGNNGDNYTINFESANLTIIPRPITVTADDKEKILGDSDPDLTYKITSGSLVNGDQITGSLIRDIGETVGTYLIKQGSLAIDDSNGGANYDLTFVEGTFTIKQISITITANAATKIYGEDDPEFTYTASDISVLLTGALGREPGENAGTYAITIGTLSAGEQYAISFVTADFTITQKEASVTPNAASKVYGDPDPVLTGTLSGFLESDNVTAVYSRAAGETVAGSPYTISAVLSPADVLGNYNITYNTAEFTITKKEASVTPDDLSKVYGEAGPSFTGTLSGFLAGDNVTAVYSREAGETVIGSPHTISAVLSPEGVLGNYDITYNTAEFTITKKEASVTPNDATKVYGEDDPAFTGTVTGFLVADRVTAVYSREAGETVAGSPYEISADLGDDKVLDNYDITYNTANFTITPKEITVAADPRTKTYGLPDPALTYVVTGIEDGDSLDGGLARLPGENVGTYQIIIGTLTAGTNYTITFVPENLTITPRSITVTADDKEKTIGDSDPALTYSITTGSLAYDDEITGDLVRDAGETLGSYSIKRGTLAIDDGNGGANYELTFVEGTFTIKQISITITATATTKVYGEDDPEFTYEASDPSVILTGELGREPGENVGTYAITIGTLSAGEQYAITLVPANLTITKRPITITVDDKEKVEGDPDPELTWQITRGELAFTTDEITGVLERESGEDVGVYKILIGSLKIDDENNGENYDLEFEEGTFNILSGIVNIFLPLIRR